MRPIISAILAALTLGGTSYGDMLIARVSPAELTYVTTTTNIYSQVQFRWDLRKTSAFPSFLESWHTLSIDANRFVTSVTNTVDFTALDLEALMAIGDNRAFFRVVGSTNPIPTTTTAFEMIMTNGADQAISNVVVVLGGANEVFEIDMLSASASTLPFMFSLDDVWASSLDYGHGMCTVNLMAAGERRDFGFWPGAQRFTIVITNGGYSVIKRPLTDKP